MFTQFEIRNLSGIVTTECFDKTTVIVGSGSGCDLTLATESEDTIRFCVELRESGATVTCLQDVGMMINRSAVFKKGETHPLRHGDVIRFVRNDLHLTFSYSPNETRVTPESSKVVEHDSVSDPNAAASTSAVLASDAISKKVLDSEVRTVGTAVWNAIREQRRIIVSACVGFLLLLVLVFNFDTTPSVTLPEIEIVVVVDEHQNKMIDLLESVRRQGNFSSLTIGDITPSVNINDAVIFNSDQRRILFAPSETDAPNEFALHLKCVVIRPDSTSELQQPVVVRCLFNEVEDLPVVKSMRSMQLGLGNTRPISIMVEAFDPDLPQDLLTYTTSNQLPDGATLDPITGAFDWIPSKSQYGETYSIVIDVTKKTKTNLVSTVEFDIDLIDDSELDKNRKKYEDSLYVLWLQHPTEKFRQPVATTVAIAPGVLATNATLIIELQKQVLSDWTVWVGRIDEDDLVPVTDMLVHGYFPPGQEQYGEGSYQSIFFDVGVVRASEEFIQSFVEVIDADSYVAVSAGQDVDLLSVNIAEQLQDTTEILSSKFTRGNIVTIDTLSFVESSKTPDFMIFEIGGLFPTHIDGAPLLADGKLLALYSSPFRDGNQNVDVNHLCTVAISLSDLDLDSPNSLWVHAAEVLSQSE
ncbi:MAG: hypothetical protein HOB73_02300 [Planctomycetaceae bacterium]|jgi:hypothetical protein|nr:hypothetical protein [Planctomycetaceae bacterium]